MRRARVVGLAAAILVSACTAPVEPTSTPPPTSTQVSTSTSVASGPTTTAVEGGWTVLSSMPVPLSESPAVVVGDSIYVAGGLEDSTSGFSASDLILAYDTTSNTWSEVGRLPEAIHHSMLAASEGMIYVIGGLHSFRWTPLSDVWAFDPTSGELTRRAPLPFGVGSGAAVELDGDIYVVGGVSRGDTLLRYDPDADTWAQLSNMGEPREHLAAVAADGLLYAIGGRFGLTLRDTIEIYDPRTDTWTPGPRMLSPRAGFAAAELDGTIYVTGGEDLDLAKTFDSGEALAPDGNAWAPIPDMPMGLHGHGMASSGGAVYVLGGSRQAGAAVNRGDAFKLIP